VGDTEELSQKLLKLILDPDLRKKMGKSSLEIIGNWTYHTGVMNILKALSLLTTRSI